ESITESSVRVEGIAEQPSQRKFTFLLSAEKMQGARCTSVKVAVDNVLLFAGSMSDVKFDQPQKDQNPITNAELNFGPVTVGAAYLLAAQIACKQSEGEGEAKRCVWFEIPESEPIWYAEISAQKSGG